jgi:hypothetical protein
MKTSQLSIELRFEEDYHNFSIFYEDCKDMI